MKLIILFCLCLLCMAGIEGCNSKEVNPSVDMVTINALHELPTLNAKRLAFNLLTPAERYFVCKEGLEKLINDPGVNDDQKSLISAIIGKINPALYDDSEVELRKQFLTVYMPEWSSRANKVFDQMERKNLMSYALSNYSRFSGSSKSLGPLKDNPAILMVVPEEGNKCDCARGNKKDCDYETTYAIYHCDVSTCSSASFGCGDFFMQSCNGICRKDGKPPVAE